MTNGSKLVVALSIYVVAFCFAFLLFLHDRHISALALVSVVWASLALWLRKAGR